MKIRIEGVKPTSPQPSGGPFKKGTIFRHGRILDTSFVPAPGQKYKDGPKALCRVTSIRRGTVFYGIGKFATHADFCAPVQMLLDDGAEIIAETSIIN